MKQAEALMPEAFIQERVDQKIVFGVLARSPGRDASRFPDFIETEMQSVPRFKEEMIELKGLHHTEEGNFALGRTSKFYISATVLYKHLEVFKTVFDVRLSSTPRLTTKPDCRLSQYRFVVRGVWKIQDFSVTYPHFVLDCRSHIHLVPISSAKSCSPESPHFEFSKLPIYYNMRYRNLVIFADKKTGEPMFGKLIELSTNFAFCEVLMPWGIVHLVSTNVNQLKRVVANSKEMRKPGQELVLTSLRYWNKRIPGTESSYLRDLRTRTTVHQVLEMTNFSDVSYNTHSTSANTVSFCSYPDEVLEKISQSETLQQQVRDDLALLPKVVTASEYHYSTLQKTSSDLDLFEDEGLPRRRSRRGGKKRPEVCFVSTSRASTSAESGVDNQTPSEAEQTDKNTSNQAEDDGETAKKTTTALETYKSGTKDLLIPAILQDEAPLSLGKRDARQQTHEWEESPSFKEHRESRLAAGLHPLGGMSFFDYDYDDEIEQEEEIEIISEKEEQLTADLEEVDTQKTVAESTTQAQEKQADDIKLPEVSQESTTLMISPSNEKRNRVLIALEKFTFLEGKSPAEWYRECYQTSAH